MTRQEFIFSNRVSIRISRHLVFWIIYSVYFFTQSITINNLHELLKSESYLLAFYSLCCFIPVIFLSVYSFLYFLLPFYLERKKYLGFTLGFFAISAIGIYINYFSTDVFIKAVKWDTNINFIESKRRGLAYCNTVWAITLAIMATGIRLSKKTYLQRKENMTITEEKIKTELQLQKSKIRPEFLFQILDQLSDSITKNSDRSAGIVLRLSDLLSYSLYESDSGPNTLEQELNGIRDYIYLEELNGLHFNHSAISVKGNLHDKHVTPLSLLIFVQDYMDLINSYSQEKHQPNLTFIIANEKITAKISTVFLDTIPPDIFGVSFLSQTNKRLAAIYPINSFDSTIHISDHKITAELELPLIIEVNTNYMNYNVHDKSTIYEPA